MDPYFVHTEADNPTGDTLGNHNSYAFAVTPLVDQDTEYFVAVTFDGLNLISPKF